MSTAVVAANQPHSDPAASKRWWDYLRIWAESHILLMVIVAAILGCVGSVIGVWIISDISTSLLRSVVDTITSIADMPSIKFVGIPLLTIYLWMLALLGITEYLSQNFFVEVDIYMGLLLVNYFTGKTRKVGSGLKLKVPWERIEERMWFSLESLSFSFVGVFMTKNGGKIIAGGFVRYAVSFDRLETYALLDESSIGVAMVGDAQRTLIEEFSRVDTEEAASSINAIRSKIVGSYGTEEHVNDMEKSLGVDFQDINVNRIEADAETQKVLTALLEAGTVLVGPAGQELSRDQLEARLILLGKPGVKKEIKESRIEGSGSFKDIHPVLLAILNKLAS